MQNSFSRELAHSLAVMLLEMQAELEEFVLSNGCVPQAIATGSSLLWSPKLKPDQGRAGVPQPSASWRAARSLDKEGWLCGDSGTGHAATGAGDHSALGVGTAQRWLRCRARCVHLPSTQRLAEVEAAATQHAASSWSLRPSRMIRSGNPEQFTAACEMTAEGTATVVDECERHHDILAVGTLFCGDVVLPQLDEPAAFPISCTQTVG